MPGRPVGAAGPGRLVVPDNIVILYLPRYSLELNPVENLWAYMRSHFLSNRANNGYDHPSDATAIAYRAPTTDLLRSVCRCDCAERD
ncbi:MAG: transposase [Phycisphaeraceae bacterium]|nr:transposase [Phycisphaeraceae bacterium]